MLKILETLRSDFFVLDDNSVKCNFKPLMEFICKYFDNSIVVPLKQKTKLLTKDFVSSEFGICEKTVFIAVGQGGQRILDFIDWIDDFQVMKVKFSRVWDENAESTFEHNLDQFDFDNKNFVIIEDVIASGKTIESFTQYIETRGGKVIGIITSNISGTSPLQTSNDDYKIIACTSLESSDDVTQKGSFESHWIPGIYSLRHLFYGEDENPEFYTILAEKYFDGEDLRPFLKKL